VGGQLIAGLAVAAVLVAGLSYLWVRSPEGALTSKINLPSFATAEVAPPDTAPGRTTLLPTDCTELLVSSPDMSALLGQPLGSVGARSVVGRPSPSVGQLERLTCNYSVPGRDAPALVLTVAGFTDPGAAAEQRGRNVAAEGPDTQASRQVGLGGAQATLLTEPNRTLLLVDYDRYTLTASIAPGVIPADQPEPVLTDLAQRVLATLVPPANRH
jgi:hypothetical protein